MFRGRKTNITLLGIGATVLAGIFLPEAVVPVVIKSLVTLVASYNVGQGFADGASKGETATKEKKKGGE